MPVVDCGQFNFFILPVDPNVSRLYQDYAFTVNEVAGRRLIELLGVVDEKADDFAPIVVYARLDSPDEWHRFFLDVQAAFWESVDSIEEEFASFAGADVRFMDYAKHVGCLPQRIISAAAFQSDDKTYLRLILDSGAEVFLVPDSDNLDSRYRIAFSSKKN